MIQVRCTGCQAVFEMDERRIAATGTRVRCPKCRTQFTVLPDGSTPAVGGADLPTPAERVVPMPKGTAPPDEFDLDLDLPSVARSGAPGDANVDLPALARAPSPESDLPSVPRPPPRPAPPRTPPRADLPVVALPKPPPASVSDATADLPSIARGAAALPLPAVARGGARSLDLPTPSRAATDLPTPAVPRGGARSVDLSATSQPVGDLPTPALARGGARSLDLPSPARPMTDLPTPSRVPAEAVGFGDLDLPAAYAPEASLPAVSAAHPARKTNTLDLNALDDLPSTARATAAALSTDLDDPFESNAPAVARPMDDLPSPLSSHDDLPASAARRPLGRVALERRAIRAPEPSLDDALPSPRFAAATLPTPTTTPLPTPPAGGIPDLPPPPSPTSLPPHDFDFDADAGGFGELDLPMGDLPPPLPMDLAMPLPPATPRRTGETTAGDGGLPLPLPPTDAVIEKKPRGGRMGGTGFGEISLDADGPVDNANDAGQEFDQIPVERDGARTMHEGIDTAVPVPHAAAASVPVDRTKGAPGQRPRAAASPHPGLYIVLAIVGTVVIGGAALSLTSAGPFGTTLIDERLHGPARHAAAQHAIDSAAGAFAGDTFVEARAALRRLDAQLAQTPREADLLAYTVYAHYAVLARYGHDASISGRARTLYDRLVLLPHTMRYFEEARAARDLTNGRPLAARALSASDPKTGDLVTMALLEGDDPAAALAAARAAVARRATPRTRFLEAKALFASDDRVGAEHAAEALAREFPTHAGSRLLLARTLLDHAETRARAVSLAAEVEALGDNASVDERTEAAVLVGQAALADDHATVAHDAFERALQLDPRSSLALEGTATILYRQGAFTDALARFQAAQSADPNDVEAHVGIAMCSLALNQPGDARAALEPLLPDHASDAHVHFWLAKTLVAVGGEQAGAEREFREAIRLDPAQLEAYMALSQLLYTLQRPDAAEQALTDARAHVADQAAVHRALGEGRAARGDLEGAETELRQAVTARPNEVQGHFLLAQILRRRQRFDEAQHEIDATARIDPQYPALLLERGTLAEARGNASAALEMFRTALSHDPTSAELAVRVGAALVATGQYAEAATLLSQLLSDHPNIAEAEFVLGRARLALGNAQDAVHLFEHAIEGNSTRADFYAYAAEANLARGQVSHALELANRAVSQDANYARGHWIHGEILNRQGQSVQALGDAQRALQLDPAFAEAWVTLADADEALGHTAEAVTLYGRALAAHPTYGEWHARLGRMLSDLGRSHDAAAELDRAAALGDPLSPPPTWLAPVHRQLGDLYAGSNQPLARRHYARFLELSAPGAPGVDDVRRALNELQ